MNVDDIPGFAEFMEQLGNSYRYTFTTEESEFYWQRLKQYPLEEVTQAVDRHKASSKYGRFMPQVGDILRWIEPSDEMQSLSAWSRVEHAMRTIGAYESVVFDDALIHVVIGSMGGWINLCHCSLQDLPFRALEFQKRYQGLLIIPPQHTPPYLCGMIENSNRSLGYPPLAPRLIGDIPKAQRLLSCLTQEMESSSTIPGINSLVRKRYE